MYLDLHSHSVSSDDSRATVEQYLKWIQVLRKRGHTVDGIVLTEHRKFDFDKDYSTLASQYDVLVLKGSELDTLYGHFLVYGGPFGLALAPAPVQQFNDTDILENLALRHVVHKPNAKPAGVGWDGDGIMLARGLHQLPRVYTGGAELDVFGQGFGDAVNQEMPVEGIQF